MKKILVLLLIVLTSSNIYAQNDSIYFYKSNTMIHKQSIKIGDLDSITFKRPTTPTGINIAGPNVTDIDGNSYQSVTNCGQTWTKSNLNVSKYSDGTPIPQVTNPTDWANLTTGAWCYYNNDPANQAVYGKLYNWYAVAGIYDAASASNPALRKKLAPTIWHVATFQERGQLIDCLGVGAGGKMKSTGTLQAGTGLWNEPNTGATNESGFSGLPGGYRSDDGTLFDEVGIYGYWWSSSEVDSEGALLSLLVYSSDGTGPFIGNKHFGFSVRCVKD
jgi:uncharacterized protein (TIGR02145 family)